MGRYYTGDIDGKFWFGVQSSDDADFFGVKGWCWFYQTEELNYNFEKDDMPKVVEGIAKCKKELGTYHKKIANFFKKNSMYTDSEIAKALKIKDNAKVQELLQWYARLELGEKILACLKENGACYFNAEC
jgi:hypothetical protein